MHGSCDTETHPHAGSWAYPHTYTENIHTHSSSCAQMLIPTCCTQSHSCTEAAQAPGHTYTCALTLTGTRNAHTAPIEKSTSLPYPTPTCGHTDTHDTQKLGQSPICCYALIHPKPFILTQGQLQIQNEPTPYTTRRGVHTLTDILGPRALKHILAGVHTHTFANSWTQV